MKAVVFTRYGSPDVLQYQEVPKPVPTDNELLIKVIATTVNRTDCGLRKAEPFIARFFMGLLKPRITILGSEFAGVVEEVGKDVQSFQKGDSVFGLSTNRYGTHAEYLCLPESGSITLKPTNLSYEEAAAVCDGAMLANTYLKKVDFSQPKKLLIYGATGSIGTAAVQLAKYYGADIIAVGTTPNLDLVKSLGAREVIDYLEHEFTQIEDSFDVVLDAVGKCTFGQCKHLLKPEGIFFSTDLGPYAQNVYLPLWTAAFSKKKVVFPIPTDTQADILFYKKLVENGHYKPVIDKCYSFNQIVEAYRYVETEQKTGNVVVRVFQNA